MIPKFSDYDTIKGYKDTPQLPRGGYVVKIMGVKTKDNSRGQYVEISCDIAEGEYRDFFANDYRSQNQEDAKWRCVYLLSCPTDDGSEMDGWTKRKFKTFTEALEDSNDTYHFDWDEQKFKGKIVGALFNYREYQKNDGSIGTAANLAQFCSVDKIRSGDFKIPKDKALSNKTSVNSLGTPSTSSTTVETIQLPFD